MNNNKTGTPTGFEIAIIGMAGRFPGAKNIDEFWDNLINGRETVSFFSDEELLAAVVNDEEPEDPNDVKAYGIIDDIEYFDPDFFGYSPADAKQMDPQMRLFHEYAWTALEDAGYDPGTYSGLIGLYVGASDNYYWQQMSSSSAHGDTGELFSRATLNNKDYISTRTSFKLNLKGPSSTLFNACSTSLIATHLGCQALLSGDCDMALAGGAALSMPQEKSYHYQEGMIYSPDGHCRTFDANAAGSVFGNGIAVVVLKRLNQAVEDGDHIYAVIKGTAVNNDGSRKISYTAPSIEGQTEVIRDALVMAEVEPESIDFIEAHGTATPLGDSIEIEALKRAFNTTKKRFCAIGTVKTNLGHLDAAAGVTGLIKTALALKHKLIPVSLHFQSPNPEIDFENSPFYVNTELKEWKNNKYPLRAGVSAFGIGGTNGHVILEEAPPLPAERDSRKYQLILLSAKTETALEKMSENLAEYFKKNLLNCAHHKNPTNPGLKLADAAYTLQVGRKAFNYRRMLTCSHINEAIEKLSSTHPGKIQAFCPTPPEEKTVFMFSGLGSQYVDMGLGLYQKEPGFREEMDRCFEILKTIIGYDIKEILYPGERKAQSAERNAIDQTEIAPLVIFIFEYALAQLLMKWGIKPRSMIGYSFGEYAAACISGVFSLEDALKLVTARGKAIKKTPTGAMLSVPLAKEALISLLPGELSLAIDNGPSCVIAGTPPAIAEFEKRLKQEKIVIMRVPGSTAVHSVLMEPVLEEFKEKAGEVVLNEPRIPFISNVTGKWITAGEATDPGYWARHLRETVQFDDGFKRLLKHEPRGIFLEIGPGRDLVVLVQRHLKAGTGQQAVNLTPPAQKKVPDMEYLLSKIGTLWLLGQDIDWSLFYKGEKRRRVSLPTYCFDYRHCGIENSSREEVLPTPLHAIKKPDIGQWFYLPQWNRCLRPSRDPLEVAGWLVFADDCGIGDGLVNTWLKENPSVIIVRKGSTFENIKPKEYVINPASAEDYNALLGDVKTLGPGQGLFQIIHLWSIEPPPDESHGDKAGMETVKKHLDLGYYSLVYLVHALEKQDLDLPLYFTVVSDSMQHVTEEKHLFPGKTPLLSLVKIIPQEYVNIWCRSIDIVVPPLGSPEETTLLIQLWKEISLEIIDTVIAFRGKHRWVQGFEPIYLPKPPAEIPVLKKRGVYLITGGLGEVGYLLAKHLARKVNARLVLTGRTPLPEREQWEKWLTSHDEQEPVTRKINQIRELEKLGAEVLMMSADVSSPEQMKTVIQQTEKVFGLINGVIHSAGIVDPRAFHPIREIDREKCAAHFNPKIYGLLVLEKVLQGRKPDFCLLMSSLSGIFGGLGFAAYSAANLFMDAFVQQQKKKNFLPWLSVAWDNWQPGEEIEQSPVPGTRQVQLFMTAKQGIEAFERVLCLEQVEGLIHCLVDLHAALEQNIKNMGFMGEEEPKKETPEPGTLAPRPNLSTPYEAPVNEIQQILTYIWQRFFETRPIGINDDFFELGGDSLKGISMTALIHKEMSVKIPVAELFDNPTISELTQYINNSERTRFTSIQVVEKKEYHVLSAAQRRLYILQQMEPAAVGYNEFKAVWLEGKIDRNNLEDIFRKLIRRHEIFRTSIEFIEGKLFQAIHPLSEIEFKIDYYEAGEDEIGELVQTFVKPFDLSKPPILRVGLINIPDHRHLLMIDMHHVVKDLVSDGIFLTEFAAFYMGNELPPLPVQYKDYAEWQDREDQQKSIKRQETHWLKTFAGEIPVLQLPTDFPRPEIQSFEGNTITFGIDKPQTEALEALALKENVTLYMVSLSIFSIFLSKLSGQEDIIIGTPAAGRRHVELQNLMGMFVNTLAMRNYPAVDKTCIQFFKEIRKTTLQAFENQDYPFEDLVEKVDVERDASRNPLFDAMFVLQNIEFSPVEIPGLRLVPYGYESRISKFDLTLQVVKTRDQLLCTFEYCKKLFKEETIRLFIQYLKTITSAILAKPGIKLSEIDIIAAEEKNRVLFEFNNNLSDYPEHRTLHQLFEEQVERTPDRIALVGKEEGGMGKNATSKKENVLLTYKELNKKSNRLAYYLMKKGVKPGSIVGIMLDRSGQLFAAMMGILKTGAAYLPMDIDNPRQRIQYILKDAGIDIFITHSEFRNYYPLVKIIELSHEEINQFHGSNPGKIIDSKELLYVIYTSGSTGKPKGVLIKHRGFVNLVYARRQVFGKESTGRISQVANPGFDAMAAEIWPCLINGSMLYIAGDQLRANPAEMKKWLVRHEITQSFQPTLIAQQLLKEEWPPRGTALRILETAGDRLTQYPLHSYPFRVYNLYGPTEDTVWTTWKEVEIKFAVPKNRYPLYPTIGKPIANHRVYIITPAFKLQPPGISGELSITGEGLAAGYLNQPELTAQKFIPLTKQAILFFTNSSSLSSSLHLTLYKTGDIARWLPDGNIDFLGRIDRQVKIRGYRIELGEIENQLNRYPSVKECKVLTKKDGTGNQYLCAYVVHNRQKTTNEITVEELREHLAAELPAYMIPSTFIKIERIPLTPNGKTDIKQLNSITTRLSTGVDYVAPQNVMEKTVANIWKEVLKIEKVSIYDNFFTIGGNSITLLQVNSILKNELGREITVAIMFKYTTISAFVQYLTRGETIDNLFTGSRALEEKRGKNKLKKLKKKVKEIKNERN